MDRISTCVLLPQAILLCCSLVGGAARELKVCRLCAEKSEPILCGLLTRRNPSSRNAFFFCGETATSSLASYPYAMLYARDRSVDDRRKWSFSTGDSFWETQNVNVSSRDSFWETPVRLSRPWFTTPAKKPPYRNPPAGSTVVLVYNTSRKQQQTLCARYTCHL